MTHEDEAQLAAPDCLLWEQTEERRQEGSWTVMDGDGHMTGPGQLPWEHQLEDKQCFLFLKCLLQFHNCAFTGELYIQWRALTVITSIRVSRSL